MNGNNSRTLLARTVGFLGAAGAGLLLSLPALAQSGTPGQADPAPTGTRVNQVEDGSGSTGTQPGGTSNEPGATTGGDSREQVESGQTGTTQQNGTITQPSTGGTSGTVNQPGATTGGDSNNQVESGQTGTTQQNGTTIQRRTTTQQRTQTQYEQNTTTPGTTGADTTPDTSATDDSGNQGGGVRALW